MGNIENLDRLPELVRLFQKHEGYWSIDQSEDWCLSITWSPFVGIPGGGGFLPAIENQHVSDINDYIKKVEEVFAQYNVDL